MTVVKLPDGPSAGAPTAVAVGYFDGVHIGHRKVISQAVALRESGLVPAVFTFSVNANRDAVKPAGMICSFEQKEALLEECGAEYVYSPDFASFKDLSPEEFVDKILVDKFSAGAVCCGEDFRFGRGGSGSVHDLRRLCTARGIRLVLVEPVTEGGRVVSSTRIRSLISEGDMTGAARLLGRQYRLSTEVVSGKKLGRTINFPTINQFFPAEQQPPKNGVYATICHIDGKRFIGATNVGTRPTVAGEEINAETFILDFEGDLYGKTVSVDFHGFLRGEKKFSGVEELRRAISDAADRARELLGEEVSR